MSIILENSNIIAEFPQQVIDTINAINDDDREFVKYKDSRPITDIKHMIETSVKLYGENPAFYEKKDRNGKYEIMTYNKMFAEMNAIGTALLQLGLKDKHIAIIGGNSIGWEISYLSVVNGVGVVVPLDKELPANMLADIVERGNVAAVIFDEKYEEIFKEIKANNSKLQYLINMQAEKDTKDVLSLQSLKNKGYEAIAIGNRDFIDAEIDREKMSILLFTSGTTGLSKGVMISHKNIATILMIAPTILKVNPDDIFFSFLPVHHTYECTCGFLMPLYKGAAIAFCQGLKYITKNLEEVKPTMFLGVPAVFENLYKKIWQNVRKQGKEKLLKKVIKINNMTKKIGIDLGNKFFKDIRAVFGGRMRMMICGGAAINPEVLEGIRNFGINAVQGYGLTECAPLAALNPEIKPIASAVGVSFPGMQVEIANPDEKGIGEICVKGDNVMLGYYEMPELTAETIVEGWFHTGDIGYKDEKGYVYISGRQKNVIITKNGENVFPEEMEYLLNLNDEIAESMVYTAEQKNKSDFVISASIVADMEIINEKYESVDDNELERIIWNLVDNYNETSPPYRIIRRVNIRKEPLKKNTSNKIIRFEEANKC